ncbi:type III secretion system translocon subunit SctE [Rhizobium alvei]|uniref:Type III secretion system translocon subunit SctE n=1 Tax=Rhizobium alvei TaxID=1132659 RepID=A0ABT8YS45_9HYPH|nr:type III secretion system translocon subunit SctE [Rhizobium alvei]MDO6966452.1 type III secretion system translocon subunit SctE [Rhizobium alvei]
MADLTIGGGGIPVNTGNLDNIQTSNVQKKGNIQNQDQIGQGTLSQTGGVPDVPTGLGAAAIISFSVIFASSSFAPKRSGDVEITLAEVSATLKDTREKTSLESVNANQEKVRTSQKEQQSKLAERKEKIEKSIADDKKSAIAKFFSRLFEALALVFTYVMAGLAMATGVGAGMGALLIAGAVAMTVMFANSVVKDATGLGIAGNIAKSMGASEEAIAKADKVFGEAMMGITVALSVLTIGAQLAPAVLKGIAKVMAASAVKSFDSAVNATGKGFDAGMKAAEKALKWAGKSADLAKYVQGASETIKESVRTLQSVARVGGAVVEIGSGTTGVISSTITYGQQKREAEAKQLEAEGQEIEALMKTLESLIDMALDMLMNANQISGEMIDSAMQSLNDRGASLSKNMFAG